MSGAITQEVARVDQRDIPGLYNRLARVYDVCAALAESKARRRALERAAVTDREDVLEVAVGTGQMLAALARANPSGTTRGGSPLNSKTSVIVGSSRSDEAVKSAREGAQGRSGMHLQ